MGTGGSPVQRFLWCCLSVSFYADERFIFMWYHKLQISCTSHRYRNFSGVVLKFSTFLELLSLFSTLKIRSGANYFFLYRWCALTWISFERHTTNKTYYLRFIKHLRPTTQHIHRSTSIHLIWSRITFPYA